MGARLQRDIHRRVAQVGAGRGLDGLDLRVRRAECAVVALAEEDLVARDHGAGEWVGAYQPPPPLCQLDRAGKVALIDLGAKCHKAASWGWSEHNPWEAPIPLRGSRSPSAADAHPSDFNCWQVGSLSAAACSCGFFSGVTAFMLEIACCTCACTREPALLNALLLVVGICFA